MNRIRAIAIVLSMTLFLLGAAGNTEEKTTDKDRSYDGIKERQMDVVCEETGEETQATTCEEEPCGQENAEAQEEAREEGEEPQEPIEEPIEELTEKQEEVQEEGQSERKIEVTEEDYAALLKLVEAEASGEDLKGKMLVANVVINRLHDGAFGSTVQEVIYQRVNGKAQFSPVATGKIERVVVSEETIQAVDQVLDGTDESQGALYFVARAYADPDNMAWFDNNLTWLFQYHGHEFYI